MRPAGYLIRMKPDALLFPAPKGLYCQYGDFYIDPVQPVERALHHHDIPTMRAPDMAMCSRRGDARHHAPALWLTTSAARAKTRARRDDFGRRPCASVSTRPAMCSVRRRSPSRQTGRGSSFPAITSDDPIRPPVLRAGRLRRFHHGSDLRPAGLPPPGRQGRDRAAPPVSRQFPRRAHVVGAYALGKAQTSHRAHTPAGLRPTYPHPWRTRQAVANINQSQGIDLGDIRPATLGQENRQTSPALCPRASGGFCRAMGAPFRRSARHLRLRLDCSSDSAPSSAASSCRSSSPIIATGSSFTATIAKSRLPKSG